MEINKDQKQVDDHVQNSALGAVKPLAEHPSGAGLMPVSPATPSAEPIVTRTVPPQKTGHDIAPLPAEKAEGAYATENLSTTIPTKKEPNEVASENAAAVGTDSFPRAYPNPDAVKDNKESPKGV